MRLVQYLTIAGMSGLLLAGCHGKPAAEKPGPYAFDVALKMSPKAEAALKKPGMQLGVDAWYYGDAAPAHRADADKLNRIDLGDERWDYSASARRIHLHGEPIDTSKLSWTRDGQVQVFLSVTAEPGNPDNLLTCHDYIGAVRLAQQSLQVMKCEFDTEDYWEDQPDTPAT